MKRLNEKIAKLEAELDVHESEDGMVWSSMPNDRIAPLPIHSLPAKKPKKEGLVEAARRIVERAGTSAKTKEPFACRLCAFRGADLKEYERHRKSDLHKLASKMYKDASYCSLCRVQCTSPAELTVHLSRKKHLEMLARH